MTQLSSRAVERSEEMIALERDCGIARIAGSLAAHGSDDCADCGDPIDARRRAAMPSAKRCTDCQRAAEQEKRRGW